MIVANSQAYELKFISVSAKKDVAASSTRDVEWATWTCTLGWPVQGIYQCPEYFSVKYTCRNGGKTVLATANDDGKINLFRWPVPNMGQVHKEYQGHSSEVTKCKFTFDDGFLVSTGGNDKCTLVWETDFGGKNKDSHISQHKAEIEQAQTEDEEE